MIAPTIIIGLGGIGSNICCRVSKLAGTFHMDNVRFICIDSENNVKEEYQQKDSAILPIVISFPKDAENTSALSEPDHRCEISRQAFADAIQDGKLQQINQTLEKFTYLEGSDKPIVFRITLISALGVDFGSDIVLPTELYLRDMLNSNFCNCSCSIDSFLLMPEIFFEPSISIHEKESYLGNTTKILKELHAAANVSDCGQTEVSSKSNILSKPFDFCYLYSKRNIDGRQLSGIEEYLDHAANTIYTQTMSGISSRSNSNEDNAIKSPVSSNGRNRFCGAGSSLLKYPRDDVLAYIADHWAAENMGVEWLTIDRAFAEEHKGYEIRKKTNPTEQEPILSDFYINAVNSPEKGSFAARLHDMVFEKQEDEESEGRLFDRSKVDLYLTELNSYIAAQINRDPDLAYLKHNVEKQLLIVTESLKKHSEVVSDDDKISNSEFADALEHLEALCLAYAHESAQVASRVGRAVAMYVFQTDDNYTEVKDARQHMESFMKDSDGNFIHPNAARYFIYALSKRFSESLTSLNGSEGLLSRLKHRVYTPFDDVTTPEVETIHDSIYKNKVGKKFLMFYVDKQGRSKVLREIRRQFTAIQGTYAEVGYAPALAMEIVAEAGIDYLRKLSDAFEHFYLTFDTHYKVLCDDMARIEHEYKNRPGRATRYVCASEICLKQMLREMPCQTEGINGKLSADIFQQMKIFALMSKQPNASNYFAYLYNKTIMQYLRNSVEDLHAQSINMDVLTALEAEADYEHEEPLTDDQRERYVVRILEEAQHLAAPFIEEPMGEVRHPFNICAYNSAVAGEPDSTRRTFVKKYIDDALSGQKADNVSKYELRMYRTIQDLGIDDLRRFAASEGK